MACAEILSQYKHCDIPEWGARATISSFTSASMLLRMISASKLCLIYCLLQVQMEQKKSHMGITSDLASEASFCAGALSSLDAQNAERTNSLMPCACSGAQLAACLEARHVM